MRKTITRKGLRLHIGIFGRRNAGKSSLLNAITRQEVSIVSENAGTTTDPVEKPMELQPIGPVLFIDTAGIDDEGALGEKRKEKTKQIFNRTDLAVIVSAEGSWGQFEEDLFSEFTSRETPIVVVFNKIDLGRPSTETLDELKVKKCPIALTNACSGEGLTTFRESLLRALPEDFIKEPNLLGDLVGPGEFAVLVVPIDKEAPKGRLILPQVQAIRNLLDNDSFCLVVKERELKFALSQMRHSPKLVVTDSQAFLKVAADTPDEVPLTSFSILFSRLLGDLEEQVRGAVEISRLKPGDRVLLAEACAHHPIADDIGRVKIPRWLTQYVGGKLEFSHIQGHSFPEDLSSYSLLVHCGACMWNRKEMLSRIMHCKNAGLPITNYGLTIAYSLGIFERALSPFPAAKAAYLQAEGKA